MASSCSHDDEDDGDGGDDDGGGRDVWKDHPSLQEQVQSQDHHW